MDLSPRTLLSAYAHGIFPMADGASIYWYDPDPRAILPLRNLHVSRSLARTLRRADFQISRDAAFGDVIRACAAAAPDRTETWISPEIVAAYERLAALGYAHSVEVWQENEIQGGLYGVAINGFFAGESMFSRRRDASKVALVHLVRYLRNEGFRLLDVQFLTGHLQRLGAVEISRQEYKRLLAAALQTPATFAPLLRAANNDEVSY